MLARGKDLRRELLYPDLWPLLFWPRELDNNVESSSTILVYQPGTTVIIRLYEAGLGVKSEYYLQRIRNEFLD